MLDTAAPYWLNAACRLPLVDTDGWGPAAVAACCCTGACCLLPAGTMPGGEQAKALAAACCLLPAGAHLTGCATQWG
jgi:hypothetical protein